jgi:Protein of unknown function
MDETQAAEIQRNLLDAAGAIDRAGEIIFNLDKDERTKLAGPLGQIVSALHFELLQAVYTRYPDLKPPAEELPTISSTLRWDEVSLPGTMSEADIDQIIFSAMASQWRKIAMVIGKAVKRCEELGVPISAEVLGARLGALAESDRIDSAGDLCKWRHSEVRLKR